MTRIKPSDYKTGDVLDVTYRVTVGTTTPSVIYGTLPDGADTSHSRDRATSITVVDRPSPFEIGARVVRETLSGPQYGVVQSASWHPLQHDHLVVLEGGGLAWVIGDRLTPAPEPEPLTVEVGTWWADEDGPCVIVRAETNSGVPCVVFRDWDSENECGMTLAAFTAAWTRLPGPPEPKPGDVYVINEVAWQANSTGHHHRIGGGMQGDLWSKVCERHTPDQMASLRVLANVQAGA